MTTLAIAGLGTTELLIILAVLVLLFGASKLPELARGSGRALRIFKAETKGLMTTTTTTRQTARAAASSRPAGATCDAEAELDAEADRARAPRRHHGLTRSTWPSPSVVSRACCAAARSTLSVPTGGWRSPTTCGSCGPG